MHLIAAHLPHPCATPLTQHRLRMFLNKSCGVMLRIYINTIWAIPQNKFRADVLCAEYRNKKICARKPQLKAIKVSVSLKDFNTDIHSSTRSDVSQARLAHVDVTAWTGLPSAYRYLIWALSSLRFGCTSTEIPHISSLLKAQLYKLSLCWRKWRNLKIFKI